MGFLDFGQNSRASQQESVGENTPRRKSETPNVDKLPDNVKAQAVEAAHPAAQLMDKATQHRIDAPVQQSGQTDGKEALMHNQSAAGKSQEAMSPTDNHKGHTATQARGRGMER